MSLTVIRMTVGRVLLVAGILVLLFIPYLLWGTGLMTARSQDALRTELHSALQHSGVSPSTTDPVPGALSTGPPKVAPHEAPPSLGSPVGSINIPKIGLSMVVVEGTGTAQLELGPGHYQGTPLPGEAGNSAIAGHRTTYQHPFYNLNDLVPGDTIEITTLQGFFSYRVRSSQTVSPSDVSVVSATSDPELTLTTCTPPYTATQRLVVHAVLAASYLGRPGAHTEISTSSLRPVAAASPRSWPVAILWGLAVTLLTTLVWLAVRRTRRLARLAVGCGGLLAWVVVVFFFFQSVAPLASALLNPAVG